jgi:hypothetical protein
MTIRRVILVSGVLVCGGGLLAAPAHAATIHVAANGDDGAAPSCGSTAQPCRSISKGIANAAAGDTVLVGPGLYGDVNGNGTLGETGEEPSAACSININKAVKVVSRDGARSTILDFSQVDLGSTLTAVCINANAAVFGQSNKGFLIANNPGGSGSVGVEVVSGTTGVTVAGNVSRNAQDEHFTIDGDSAKVEDNLAELGALLTIGFHVTGGHDALKRNTARNTNHGFEIEGNLNVVTGNLAIANRSNGFFIILADADPTPVDVSAKNGFTKNAAINNGGGVNVSGSLTADGTVDVRGNSMFGNGAGGGNCGLLISNFSPTTLMVNCDGNWWGAASGPGADPADQVCLGPPPGTIVQNSSAGWKSSEVKVLLRAQK